MEHTLPCKVRCKHCTFKALTDLSSTSFNNRLTMTTRQSSNNGRRPPHDIVVSEPDQVFVRSSEEELSTEVSSARVLLVA